MAGTYVGMYDTTAANNTATGTSSVSIAEGMAPSNINNAMRDIMADIRQWYNAAEWIEYGDGAGTYTPAQTSGTQFTIASVDVTAAYHVGRRVKAVGSSTGTIYGSITATSFSTNTTITVSWDSGSLSSETLKIYIGIVSASNTSLPETTSITGDYTLDVSGDIILDGDGGDIFFKDGGTTFGSATNTSGNLIIKSGTTTALTFSGANATIAGDLTISGDDLTMGTNTSGAILVADGTNYNPAVVSGDIAIATNGVASIGSGVIVNADVSGSAAIADSKLATISTAGKVDIGALEIDGASDIGAGLADADLIIVDDNAGGTEKKAAMSRVATYIQAGISGDITISSGTAAIGSGVIVNADVNSSAAIADSKLATISTAGKVDIGALEIDGATEMGAGIVDADLFIIDDGAGGTEKSCLASRIKTYVGAPALTGSTNNTIVTVTGASAVQGEANLTFDGTNLLIASTGKLYLNDAGGEHISGSGSVLSIAGGSEIDLTATAIDINGTCDISGTFSLAGTNVSATAAELNYSDLATLGTSAASKVLSADANNLTKISGGIYIEEATLTFDTTQDWDVRASPVAKVTLTGNTTFDAPSNPTTGQFISIVCIQDGTGSRTIAWNGVFEFTADTAPTATTTASRGDMFNFRYNGTKWLEVGRNLNLVLS